jgi:hypothetical protein
MPCIRAVDCQYHNVPVPRYEPIDLKPVIFWDVMLCSLVDRYQYFGRTWFPSPPALLSIFNTEAADSY